jgi:hypothetical protein
VTQPVVAPGTFTVAPTATSAATAISALDYKPGPLFDFARGDFARDGTGRIITASPHVTWAQRQIKRVLTRRRTSPLYSPEYGTALDLDIRERGRANRESMVAADIRSQLRADPMTMDATQFRFEYTGHGRTVNLSLHISPTVGSPTDIGFPSLFTQQ